MRELSPSVGTVPFLVRKTKRIKKVTKAMKYCNSSSVIRQLYMQKDQNYVFHFFHINYTIYVSFD